MRFALDTGALLFGSFVTKAGRETPYFFNSAKLSSGRGSWLSGQAMAEAAMSSGLRFDMLFGPAYKGIPLAAITASALQQGYGLNVKYAYNRKEDKKHGEGGQIVGARLEGRVLIVDDVLTAGTSARETIHLIHHEGAEVAGLLVVLDRQERGFGTASAAQELSDHYGIAVCCVFGLDSLLSAVRTAGLDPQILDRLAAYRERYGAEAR